MESTKTILITGASSGIGAALAREYARAGVTLALTGRNAERLSAIAKECEQRGAKVISKILDVTEKAALENWINELPELDIVIANAGIGLSTRGAEADRETFATNIGGVMNTILPAIEKMKTRHSGQIVIIASLAGLRGLPSAPAYSASKACVLAYGQGLRGTLHEFGIGVSVICPGYIQTPLTDGNKFPMPFLMTAEKAAKIMARGIAKKKSIIAFPFTLYALIKFLNFMPVIITDRIFRSLPKK